MELAAKPAWVRGSLEGEAQKWTKTRLMVESCSTMSVIRLADQSRADLAPLCPRSDSRRCPPIFISFLSWRAPQLFSFCHLRHSLKNQRIRLTAFLSVAAERWFMMMSMKLKETWPGYFWEKKTKPEWDDINTLCLFPHACSSAPLNTLQHVRLHPLICQDL